MSVATSKSGSVSCLVVALASIGVSAIQAQVTESVTFSHPAGMSIPDNNPNGLALTVEYQSTQIAQITGLEVYLNVTGGFNGDYYAYLTHDSGFAVLLNRVGREVGNPFGYSDPGFDVTLTDSAANGDVHTYRTSFQPANAPLSGVWAPDARVVDPDFVFETTPRTAYLSSFNGLNPNGAWTLFVADLDAGGSGALFSWGLGITGVPEPSPFSILVIGSIGILVATSRRAP